MSALAFLLATRPASADFDRCIYKTDGGWYSREENVLRVHNLTVDTTFIVDPLSPNGVRYESWAHMSVTSSVWEDGIMDCNAKDHGVQPNHYSGAPEEGLVWYDCVPRNGSGQPYHYWMQVAIIGMNGDEPQTGDNMHSLTFNETFTCEADHDYV
jgi:hypothetical protein